MPKPKPRWVPPFVYNPPWADQAKLVTYNPPWWRWLNDPQDTFGGSIPKMNFCNQASWKCHSFSGIASEIVLHGGIWGHFWASDFWPQDFLIYNPTPALTPPPLADQPNHQESHAEWCMGEYGRGQAKFITGPNIPHTDDKDSVTSMKKWKILQLRWKKICIRSTTKKAPKWAEEVTAVRCTGWQWHRIAMPARPSRWMCFLQGWLQRVALNMGSPERGGRTSPLLTQKGMGRRPILPHKDSEKVSV